LTFEGVFAPIFVQFKKLSEKNEKLCKKCLLYAKQTDITGPSLYEVFKGGPVADNMGSEPLLLFLRRASWKMCRIRQAFWIILLSPRASARL